MNTGKDLSEGLRDAIAIFMNSGENSLKNSQNDRAFDLPLLGFVRGDDPIFDEFKECVDPLHWTPLEAFSQGYPDSGLGAADLSVISWVLPQTAKTRKEHRQEKVYPSESWARARILGEEVNDALRRWLVGYLSEAGIQALAPVLLPAWSRVDSRKYVWASKWSERHMAYAAGLGTFGLCDGLITARGKAVRVGSIVAATTDLHFAPRPYDDHHAYCLYYTTGKCFVCAERCPVDAISENGHDKVRCRNHVHETCKAYVEQTFGLNGYACGLCQTAVPCESRIPMRPEKNEGEG